MTDLDDELWPWPSLDRETAAEVLCNLEGEDPNNPVAWKRALTLVDEARSNARTN